MSITFKKNSRRLYDASCIAHQLSPLPPSIQRRWATGAHFSAAILVLPQRISTSSGASISVEPAFDDFTMAARARGLSKRGQGRRWFLLKGCRSLYSINKGD